MNPAEKSNHMNSRSKSILYALINEYVASATPVGSRTIVDRYELGCSPATVRNELSALEDQGYLAQPHTSAGRVPTDAGYRSLVNELITGPTTQASNDLIDDDTAKSRDIDDLMRRASNRLTAYTRCLALTKAPAIANTMVKRIELLSLSSQRVLFVLITDSGQVVNRTIELDASVTPEEIAAIGRSINAACCDKKASDIVPLRLGLLQASSSGSYQVADELMGRIIDEILDALAETDHEHVRHAGVAALLAQPEFRDTARAQPLVDLLERGLDVMELVANSSDDTSVFVGIGHENSRDEFGDVTVIVAPYKVGDSRGYVGVVGPTRMDYLRSIGAVHTMAHRLSEIIEKD